MHTKSRQAMEYKAPRWLVMRVLSNFWTAGTIVAEMSDKLSQKLTN